MTRANKVTHGYFVQTVVRQEILKFAETELKEKIAALGIKHRNLTNSGSSMFVYKGEPYNMFDKYSSMPLDKTLRKQMDELLKEKQAIHLAGQHFNDYVAACFNASRTPDQAVSLFFDSLKDVITESTKYKQTSVDQKLRFSINERYKETVELAKYYLTLKLLQ